MWQFLQTYGIWIVFGIFMLMMCMHRGGMGAMHSGKGGMRHGQSDDPLSTQRAVPLHDSIIESQREVSLDDAGVPAEKEEIPSNQYPVRYHPGSSS